MVKSFIIIILAAEYPADSLKHNRDDRKFKGV